VVEADGEAESIGIENADGAGGRRDDDWKASFMLK
jgi:hypothetical protein